MSWTVVVDASAMVKWLVVEADGPAYRAWHAERMQEGVRFVAPHLLRYELGQVLSRIRPTEPAVEREERLSRALLGILFADSTEAWAYAPPLSYYDVSYLSLAQSMKATLVSYDKVMLAAAKKAGIYTTTPT